MEPVEFREILFNNDLGEIIDNVILKGDAKHFDSSKQQELEKSICRQYGIGSDDINLWIVGSAKFGFSISEKKEKDGTVLPRFRYFRPESDIDVAIVSPRIFDQIWFELTQYAYKKQVWMPWDSKRLGDYMIYGWMRPDHFPRRVGLRRCDDWWNLFSRLSADSRFGRRPIRGALYYSLEHLKQYQLHSLLECRSALEATI